ncbi:hypothetical protein IV203_018119 [Nitzschia inconspicua]|uniref:Uncharacterized protein n=1 Tax=Nitzschia inconspicua TaxID=303405 RepID=A0A9K3M198_9STRA|nr:hypothetical protein IV203_018119 [Nitzschia inconspicua]
MMKLFVSFTTLAALAVSISDVAVAAKYSYRSTGRGGSASIGGDSCGAWPFGSYLDVYAFQDTYKVNGKGEPENPPLPYLFPYFSLWSDCTAETATLIEPIWDSFDETPAVVLSFPSNNKLQTGSASGSVPARKMPCTIVSEVYDDGEEYLWYNCDPSESELVTIDLSVNWTGGGSTYQSSSSCSSRSAGWSDKYSVKGTVRDATFDLSLRLDSVPVELSSYFDESSYKSGSLFKSTTTSIYRFKY